MAECQEDKYRISERLDSLQEIFANQRLWEVDELSLKLYKKEIRRFKPLGYDEEQQLMLRAENGDALAIERLILSNLGFVINVARKYQNLGLPLNDLISEGNLGLIKAAQKVQGHRFTFKSFAIYEIRSSIFQALHKHSCSIHYPTDILVESRRVQKFILKFELSNGYCPTDEEIAEALNMAIDDVTDSRYIISQELSIDLLSDYINNLELLEGIVGNLEMIDADLNSESLYIDTEDALNRLCDREKVILKMFFGIGCEEMTLVEIGNKFNLTGERTRQIKEKAIRKLKSQMSRHLKKYLG